MRKPSLVISALAAVLLLSACSSTPPAPEQAAAGVEDRQAVNVDGAQINNVQAGQTLDAAALAAQLRDPNNILSKREVFFDFDQYVIRDEYRALVEAHARFLANNPGYKVLIQGNADDRGSREYNLALGQKRAETVKKSLLLLGAREDQVEAVSLGEEKPRCNEQAESCWSQNRRGDILYSGEF